jgi:hypothetical protein
MYSDLFNHPTELMAERSREFLAGDGVRALRYCMWATHIFMKI